MLKNSIEYIVSYFAIHRLGGIVVQLNPGYTRSELNYFLSHSEAKILIGTEEQREKLTYLIENDFIQGVQFIAYSMTFELNKKNYFMKEETSEPIYVSREDVAVLQYTGGTTGRPKGVMLTHNNFMSNIIQAYHMGTVLDEEQKEVYTSLGTAPMFHAMGLSFMMTTLFDGNKYIAIQDFKASDILELLRKYKPNILANPPTVYIALINHPETTKEDLVSLKYCISGAAPMSTEFMEKFNSLTELSITEGYGLSEGTTGTHRNPLPADGVNKVGSIGVPIVRTEAKIMDVDNPNIEMRIGEIGELVVRGPQVMKGYWRNEEETRKTIREGWLYTGDISYRDEDGYYYIVGRKGDLIIAGGYNIYPNEIEQVLYEHPHIMDVCVYGIPDEYLGEKLIASIVTDRPLELNTLANWCAERIVKYKIPREFDFREEIPKNRVGKVLRSRLIEEAMSKMK